MIETDVLVIGGGATGGGIAWDLALRGVRVVLAEMGDLATGTSGRYHGLLHSGARYAVRDLESAIECIDENRIIRQIAPEAIEDTSGFFVLCPSDDTDYVAAFRSGCAQAGIPVGDVPLREALRREKLLNPRLELVLEVPDGTCDSWDLLHLLQNGAEQTGRARFLTYHRVDALHQTNGSISGARLTNLRSGEAVDVSCGVVINAAGPWAAQVGSLGGAQFSMKLSRGAMLAYNIRWVNTVINKLRKPGDGDIFVPVGTVSVIGTTSVTTDDPADIRVEPWEVTRILDEAEAMTPGISRARILRAWGGVRPLYDPGPSAEGRGAKRTFVVLDHAETDGVGGFISIVGGKLTTFRLMAERAADLACAKLNIAAPCTTASTVLPAHKRSLHRLRDRLDALEHGENPGALVCECEIVTAPQIRAALEAGVEGSSDVVTLNDLRRDLRLGMGPCQGGFCAVRAAALRLDFLNDDATQTSALLEDFIQRRVNGMRPLLWGHNLRQAMLTEQIYRRVVGLGAMPPVSAPPSFSAADLPARVVRSERLKIVIVGGGLAGLMAALAALRLGAQVEVVSQGQGTLPVYPGWVETGAVDQLAACPGHPYSISAGALPAGLALYCDALGTWPSTDMPLSAITMSGAQRPVALSGGLALHPLSRDARLLVIGINGWRDSFPQWTADGLRAQGFDARAVRIDLPHRGGNFDDWPLDYARLLDTEEGQYLVINQVQAVAAHDETLVFPAILGVDTSTRTRLEMALRRRIIEVPTLSPSVSGMRVQQALGKAITTAGGRIITGPRVTGLSLEGDRATGILAETAVPGRPHHIPADAIILATGGLYGGGLESDYRGDVREVIAGLPLHDVPAPEDWFSQPLFGDIAQPIRRVRLKTDAFLRPLRETDQPYASNVYAAGQIVGGFSPVTDGCGEGVDLATGTHAALCAVRIALDAGVRV